MKIVPCEKRAEYFLDGRLYCNTLRFYRKRDDEQEGAIALPPSDMRLNSNLGSFSIPKEDVVGVTMQPDVVANLNVFCMYSWTVPKVGDDEVLFDKASQLGSIRELKEVFGRHVVVVKNVTEFLSRVTRAAAHQDSGVLLGKGRLVQYTEADRLPRNMAEAMDVAFHKREKFAKEHEYRFAFHADREPGPFVLSIGGIRDIAFRMDIEDLYDSVKVNGSSSF